VVGTSMGCSRASCGPSGSAATWIFASKLCDILGVVLPVWEGAGPDGHAGVGRSDVVRCPDTVTPPAYLNQHTLLPSMAGPTTLFRGLPRAEGC
jgi:hypothetical protein